MLRLPTSRIRTGPRAGRHPKEHWIVEAGIALRLRAEIKPSRIPGAGLGVFALDVAPRGEFLGMEFLRPDAVLQPEQITEMPPEIRRYAWRHVENLCFPGSPPGRLGPTELMNHSFEPNVLCHVDHYFALRDIRVGDELTFDYRTFWGPEWPAFTDAASGRQVRGMEWRAALLHTTRQLIELLETAD